jgi:hypothetical protein
VEAVAVDTATVQMLVTLVALGISTGSIIRSNAKNEGKRQEREDDLYRRMQLAEQWQTDRGATTDALDAVQAAFQDSIKSILESVNTRMRGVEENVGKVEGQVKELREYMMRRNHVA